MFSPLPLAREKALDDTGKLILISREDESIDDYYPAGQFDITYITYANAPTRRGVFECVILSTDEVLIVKDLWPKVTTMESIQYYFLKRAIDCIEDFAKKYHKSRISIRLDLPHCAEILADKKYEIIKTDSGKFLAHKLINGDN